MECAASIVNEKNSENSLLRDECGETLYGQVLTQLTNAIANLLSSIFIASAFDNYRAFLRCKLKHRCIVLSIKLSPNNPNQVLCLLCCFNLDN